MTWLVTCEIVTSGPRVAGWFLLRRLVPGDCHESFDLPRGPSICSDKLQKFHEGLCGHVSSWQTWKFHARDFSEGENAGASIRIGGLGKHDACSFGTVYEYKVRPSVYELIEPACCYDLWEKSIISSVLSYVITHLGCLDSDSEASNSSGVPTLR